MGAVLAALDMAAERRGPAGLDRRHRLQLGEAHVTGVGLAPRRPMGAKDVGDPRTAIQDATRGAAPCGRGQAGRDCPARLRPSRFRGRSTSRMVLTATRV